MTAADLAPTSPNVSTWLTRAARGDAEAWRAIVQAYTPRLYALALRSCRDRELAEEVTQATFVKAVQAVGTYREQGKFEAWLFRIAMNHLRDEWRRQGRRAAQGEEALRGVATGGAGSDPASSSENAEELGRVVLAVAEMPEADRQVLYLRYTASLSFVQIARALRRPLGTVLARHHRALGKLRKHLAGGQAE